MRRYQKNSYHFSSNIYIGSDHFIWLKYVQEANGSTVLTAVVNSLSIIVNMEFYLEFSSFLSFAVSMTSNFKEVSDARKG